VAALLLTVAVILGLNYGGVLPSQARTDPATTAKLELLEKLPTVNAVGYDPDALLLFSGKRPVMVIWTSSSPAELYQTDGTFVGNLTEHEFGRVLAITTPLMGDYSRNHPPRARKPRVNTPSI